MSESKNNCKFTMAQVLFPVSLLSFTLLLLFAFQTTQILRDRTSLREVVAQQDRPFEDSNKLLTQLQAIVAGTQKLSDGGNKSAKLVIDRLKTMGVLGEAPKEQAPTGAKSPVPAASEKQIPGPVKP